MSHINEALGFISMSGFVLELRARRERPVCLGSRQPLFLLDPHEGEQPGLLEVLPNDPPADF